MDLEICVDSVQSAVAAESGGAQRVELCSGLIEGGLTPSLGLIQAVRKRISIGVHVMIRPRGGDFLYSEDEIAIMHEDVLQAAQAGVAGVVFGLLTADGDIDVRRTRELVERARPMEVTFHRAIDMSRNVATSLEDVIESGAHRVLTSGGESTALLGISHLCTLVRAARGRIALMAGGAVRAENVQEIARNTGVTEFHASLRSVSSSPIRYQVPKVHLGDPQVDDYVRSAVWPEDVRMLRKAMDAAFTRSRNNV